METQAQAPVALSAPESIASWRWWHKWTAIILAIPLLFLTLTGIFLQIRAEVSWIQPPMTRGSARFEPTLPMDQILAVAKSVPELHVSSWAEVQMLDLRPRSGVVKIRTWQEMEAQIDAKTGKVLSVKQRLNDIVSQMHDGSYWGVRLWIGLPVAILACLLMIAGVFLLWRQSVEKIRSARERKAELQRLRAAGVEPRRAAREPVTLRGFAWKYHYWLSLIVLVPWIVVTASGLLLQLRYELSWVMPQKVQGVSTTPTLPFPAMYEAAKAVPEAQVGKWQDVWRIYYYPNHGSASLMVRHGARSIETQVDFNTGKVLDVSVRTKDLLEDIHEGKFYEAHLWWFLPTHLVALILWLTGVIMVFAPPPKKKRVVSAPRA